MFTIVVGGGQCFIEESREAAKNVTVNILGEALSVENTGSLIRKFSPHATLIPGAWAKEASGLAIEHKNTKIFVSGGIEKKWTDEWDESGLSIFVVSGKVYKALLDLEAHLKFTSPANFRLDEPEKAAELPPGFFFYEDFASVQELVTKKPVAVLVAAGKGVMEKIRALRREFGLSAVPVVVVGECDVAACYAVGADECVVELDYEAVERIRNRINKMCEMWKRATRDDLTGLYKRGFLNDYLKEQERRYRETGVPFTVMMADLDHFKQVNDIYGHQAGDAVLIAFGEFLLNSLRADDIAVRYGGEEFVVGFARTDAKEAAAIAERLCRTWALKEIEIPSGKKIKTTFSAGVAVRIEGKKDAIAAADEALYRAKRSGRNCVGVSGEAEVPGEADVPSALLSAPPFQRPYRVTKVRFATRILTVCSPWTPGAGVTSLVIASAEELVRRRIAVAIVDADFKRPELATRVGLPAEEMWKYDWRYGSAALRLKKNLYVFPLDNMTKPPPVSDQINDVIRMAQEVADLVIIDAGDDPEFSAPGSRLLVVDESKTTSDVMKAWEFYNPFSQGAVLLRGSGSVNSDSFGMPLLGVFNPGNMGSQVKALLDSWDVQKKQRGDSISVF